MKYISTRSCLLLSLLAYTTQARPFISGESRVPMVHKRSMLKPNTLSSSRLRVGTLPTQEHGMSGSTQSAVLGLRGGVNAEVSDIVVSAYDFCINLGAPCALVAGAVIATIYETISSGALEVRSKDKRIVRFLKRMTRTLLLSAFALEVLAIFVTTVTGTMLLSRTLDYMDEIVPVTADTTPLAFLRNNFEFEYLTARIAFLQGLVNWVAAVSLTHIIPSSTSGATRKMNKFIGSSLITLVLLMLSFYNNHMTFYENYFGMLKHWFDVTMKRFVFHYPPRPMVYVIAPSLLLSVFYGIQTFFFNEHEGEDEEVFVSEY